MEIVRIPIIRFVNERRDHMINFWLIYADEEGRQCKPFNKETEMENYIDRNKDYITVLDKTKVIK